MTGMALTRPGHETLNEGGAVAGAENLECSKGMALMQAEKIFCISWVHEVALGNERLTGEQLCLHLREEDGNAGLAEFARPFAVTPAQSVEENLFDGIFA